MSYVEYNSLLFEISRRLDQLNEHEHLLFMCRGSVASRTEEIPDAISLFRELEERNDLGIDQVELLKELLKGVGEWCLFQKVKKFEAKRKEYNDLLERISRTFDESNHLQQLIVICKRKTSEEYEGNIQNVRTLFQELESRGYLGFGRLDFLKGIISETERQDQVKEVQDFEKRRNDEDEFERRKGKDAYMIPANYATSFKSNDSFANLILTLNTCFLVMFIFRYTLFL